MAVVSLVESAYTERRRSTQLLGGGGGASAPCCDAKVANRDIGIRHLVMKNGY
jgi:hypothetical protein